MAPTQMNVSGNWSQTGGTFTAGSGTVSFNAASGTQQITSINIFNNGVHPGPGVVQLLSTTFFSGSLSNQGGTFNTSAKTLTVTGLTTNSGGNFDASAATLSLTGGLTLSGGSLNGSSGIINVGNVLIDGGSLVAPSGAFNVSGNWTLSSGSFRPGTGSNTVTFNGSSGTQTLASGGTAFNNLTHSGADTVQLITNPLTVNGNLVNSAGVLSLSGMNLTVKGSGANFSNNNGTVLLEGIETITSLVQDTAFGTWEYIGTGTTSTITILHFGTVDYHNLILDPTDGTDTFVPSAALNVGGTFTVDGGIYQTNNLSTAVTGLTTIVSAFYNGGTGTQTLSGGLNMTGGTLTTTGSGSTLLGGNLTATSDSTGNSATINGRLSLGAATRTFAVTHGSGTTDLLVNAIISGSGGILQQGNGFVHFTASSTYTGSTTIQGGELTVDGSVASSPVALLSGTTLAGIGTVGALTSFGGTVDPGDNGGAGVLTVNGNLSFDQRHDLCYSARLDQSGQGCVHPAHCQRHRDIGEQHPHGQRRDRYKWDQHLYDH